ncbi:MAG: Zn-dependent exopeptidase M28 [candidate division Zixibacteria bacterium]|nr:Zn-dependent exopeptidase M28 [candidate division Zixibacteria bacterium]
MKKMSMVLIGMMILAMALSSYANEKLDDLIQRAAYGDLETITAQVNQSNIEATVLAMEGFPSRMAGTENADLSRAWLVTELAGLGYTAVLDSFSVGIDVYGCNVYAYLEGQSHPDYYIVVGGHRDSYPGSPGANDNATSVAGFLEMARILKDIGTQVSFIFAFYDAKEVDSRRLGSIHHAQQLAHNDDNVILMMNMDVIGNSNSSMRLYYYPDITNATLAQSLMSSLSTVSITGIPSGLATYYDSESFQNLGFNTLTAREFTLSMNNHGSSDSAVYVDYNYTTEITRGMLATAIVIDDAYAEVDPGLYISYPDGLPDFLIAETGNSIQAKITGVVGGTIVPGTVEFNYLVNENPIINTILMTDLGDGIYEAVLPAFECDEKGIQFYVSAEESGGEIFNEPDPLEPFGIEIATEMASIFFDDMESDMGWTFSTTKWARGKPLGGGGSLGAPDPFGAYNSESCLGYYLFGDYNNNISEEYATSPSIDCSEYTNVYLKYKRWLGVGDPASDHARVEVSQDGTNWNIIWENSKLYFGGYWADDLIDITSVAAEQSDVYIRFVMGSTNASDQYCGWNIDDLELFSYNCVSSWICGDVDGTPGINILDIVYLVNFVYKGGSAPDPMDSGNLNGTMPVNILDIVYLVNYVYKSGPEPSCIL